MSCTACPDVPFFTSVTVLRTISQVCPPFHSQSVWLKWDPNAYTSTREPKCHNWRSPCAAVQMQHSQKVKIKKTCKHRVRHVSQDKVRPERTSKAVMETLFGERVFLSPSQKWAHARSVQSTACPDKRPWLSNVIWLLLEFCWWDVTSPPLGEFCLRLKPVQGGRVRGPTEDKQGER